MQGFRLGELQAFRHSQFPGQFKAWLKEGQSPPKFPTPHKQLPQLPPLPSPREELDYPQVVWALVWAAQPCVQTGCRAHLLAGEQVVIQLERRANAPPHLGRLLSSTQGILLGHLACQLLGNNREGSR